MDSFRGVARFYYRMGHCDGLRGVKMRYVISLALLAISAMAYADYPAVQANTKCGGKAYSTCDENFANSYGGVPYANETRVFSVSGGNCGFTLPAYPNIARYNICAPNTPLPTCPNGGMLSGSTCVVTCPAGQVVQADGYTCAPPPSRCQGKDQLPPTFAWVSFNKGQSPYGQRCRDGCMVYQTGPVTHATLNPNGDSYVGGTHDRHELMKTQFTSTECTVGQDGSISPEPTVDPNKAPPPVPKKPVCGATEGVLTTSSGTVACVPEGTVEARKPGVTQEKKTETFQDGSKKETTTTTTQDPATNAKDTTVSTTTTAGPTGGTAAGTPGTSTSNGSTVGTNGSNGAGGDGEGGDGDCDPTLNFCGGPATDGLYKAKTKTVGDALDKFVTGVKGSSVGGAMTGFFNVTTPGGGCPSWSVSVPLLNVQLDLSQYFCTPTAISMMDLVGSVLLAVASFVAFRWAIL